MSGQVEPPAKEIRGLVNVTLPVSLIERMRRYTDRRMRSAFVAQAIADALDRADQDRERATV